MPAAALHVPPEPGMISAVTGSGKVRCYALQLLWCARVHGAREWLGAGSCPSIEAPEDRAYGWSSGSGLTRVQVRVSLVHQKPGL